MPKAIKIKKRENPKAHGHLKICVWNVDGSLAQEGIYDNLVVDAGLSQIIEHLVDPTPTPVLLRIDEVALGTGTNAPAPGDTALQTEVYRNNIASANGVAKVGTFTGFFSPSETNGTYREAGLFIDGTVLFSRVAINITKSAAQSMTIEWTVTMTAS